MGEERNKRYICKKEQLNDELPEELVQLIHGLFEGDESWRVRYNGMTPEEFLSKYGIDYGNLTVRDAVALDVVKLDDESVSNDSEYTFNDHIGYSREEYDRFLLNKNFRINLVNIEPEWTYVYYKDTDTDKLKRTVEKMYQGVVLSKNVLKYFKQIFELGFDIDGKPKPKDKFNPEVDVYVPFTNGYDLTTEISLIPNTHEDFSPISSRAYYDRKHLNYLDLLNEYGITAISSFALVDPEKGKTHTGEYLIKVQKKVADEDYRHIVARMNSKGQFCKKADGSIDITLSHNTKNTILCVCKDDIYRQDDNKAKRDYETDSTRSEIHWLNGELAEGGVVPVEKSTTSSHYSVFEQDIPDHELKYVRNYIQFKTRLEGMEMCLVQLKRDIERKDVQCSECFQQETFAIRDMFREFNRIKELIAIQIKFYKTLDEYDETYAKLSQASSVMDGKKRDLQQLLDEYSKCTTFQMDRKLELGQQIKSLKMEMEKSNSEIVYKLNERVEQLKEQMTAIQDEFNLKGMELKEREMTKDEWEQIQSEFNDEVDKQCEIKAQQVVDDWKKHTDKSNYPTYSDLSELDVNSDKLLPDSYLSDLLADNAKISDYPDYREYSCDSSLQELSDELLNREMFLRMSARGVDANYLEASEAYSSETCSSSSGILRELDYTQVDVSKLEDCVRESEKWRDYVLAMGYELNQMQEMLTIAEDNTIKVRRLVRNFEDRIKATEEQVWDSDHKFKTDFSFTGITSASLWDIILLHDWYACNAPQKTYDEMGFNTENEFLEFRKKCNRISLGLRKNQYRDMLQNKREKLQQLIMDLENELADKHKLQYKDKYGWEAKADEKVEKVWSISDVDSKVVRGLKTMAIAYEQLKDVIVAKKPRSVDKTISELKEYHNADIQLKQREFDEKQYQKDFEKVTERTVNYLIDIGMIKSQDELENLALRNKVMMNSDVNVYEELECVRVLKETLDGAVDKMKKHRGQIQKIIDRVYDAEKKIRELKLRNKEIFNSCIYQSNKQVRNKLLLEKLENEQTISKLTYIVNTTRKDNLEDFTTLEKLRDNVDNCQKNYDKKVREFKLNVGVNQEVVNNLVMHIYNKYQDEILDKEVN